MNANLIHPTLRGRSLGCGLRVGAGTAGMIEQQRSEIMNGPLMVMTSDHVGQTARERLRARAELHAVLRHRSGREPLPVDGVYAGAAEHSYLIPGGLSLWDAADLAKQFQQESVLVVNRTGKAALVFPDGQTELLGEWREVATTAGLAGYTKLPDGRIFAAV